jgi:hypothetical protein
MGLLFELFFHAKSSTVTRVLHAFIVEAAQKCLKVENHVLAAPTVSMLMDTN